MPDSAAHPQSDLSLSLADAVHPEGKPGSCRGWTPALGLTNDPKPQVLLFVFLFLTYMLSVAGNLIVITLTLLDFHLKTPICYFLWNFSFLEVSFTMVCIPRFLYSMATGDNTVTFSACATQLFFIVFFATSEFFPPAAMSYNCYMGICKPLHHTTLMNSRVCTALVLCCWLAGLLIIFPALGMGLQLEFCDSNVIDHFGCDTSPILQITCSDTVLIERIALSFAVLTLIFTLLCVVLSYTHIVKTILRFPSAQQRKKAFFHLFFPHDCGFHHLWQLHLHLHQAFSKGRSGHSQSGVCALNFHRPFAESIYLHT